ncbi:HlyD family efflux transporter periplasmic adaptor subunit [Derxia lacustris]|uniref:HlyD family efflux transporter periplasmic adaptor subunit n=1 Tax=Derxia lacustris TaxID=764842 RepID=UPI001C38C5A0|nr:HlyD family efflux transporter periplasmic adaptor subunit [Derxia lacustris]
MAGAVSGAASLPGAGPTPSALDLARAGIPVTAAALAASQPQPLPPLREDLSLHPGPRQPDGSPSWTLHDPAANRFYQLGWAAFEIVSRWRLGTAEAIVAAVRARTTLDLGAADVKAVADFLARHSLLRTGTPEHTERLIRIARARRLGHAMWLLKHYLFIRIPLLRPEPLLQRLAPAFALVCTARFAWLLAAAAVLGLGLVAQRWDEFTHTFAAYAGLQGLVGVGAALGFAKVLHEFGHALTARRFGCRVPTMGVAFLVLVPVLYTDTSDAWKLPARRQRLAIGAAGMAAEGVLAVAATLAWSFLPDGPLRAGMFLLATTTWIATLAINASPFMRFDGYFLLSDALGLPNLHDRAFALGRWALRRALFGWNDPPPERFAAPRRRFLVAFAFATWAYRAVVFLGIALLVYHLFFKALGLLMLAVELGWFLARPVWSELAVWRQRRAELRWNGATRRSAVLLALAFAALVLPWQRDVGAPAQIGAHEAQSLYAPAPAEVVDVAVRDGAEVTAGQLLARLRAPELDAELARARVREAALRWQVERQPLDAGLLAGGEAMRRQWDGAREQVAALERLAAQLELTAPIAGRVVDASDALRPGTVIAGGERLLGIVAPGPQRGEAFVDEVALARLNAGAEVVFIADRPEARAVHCRLGAIDRLRLAALDAPALASVNGGPIAVQRSRDALLPTEPLFRLRFDQCDASELPVSEATGTARVAGSGHSLLGRAWRAAWAAVSREAAL